MFNSIAIIHDTLCLVVYLCTMFTTDAQWLVYLGITGRIRESPAPSHSALIGEASGTSKERQSWHPTNINSTVVLYCNRCNCSKSCHLMLDHPGTPWSTSIPTRILTLLACLISHLLGLPFPFTAETIGYQCRTGSWFRHWLILRSHSIMTSI